MNLKKDENSDWQEGYINNVWCRFKTFLSSRGDLFVVAKKDSAIRVFILKKKVIEENRDEDFNDIMAKAKEISSSKIPRFIRKVL